MRSSLSSSLQRWLLAALLACVCLLQPVAAKSGFVAYDPAKEGFFERATRSIQTRFMSRTDEEITEHRLADARSLHPTFHPRILQIEGGITDHDALAKILDMPPPPPRREGVTDQAPWTKPVSTGAGGGAKKDKVWVILASAPQGDPTSRGMNQLFNATVAEIFGELDEATSAQIHKDVLGDEEDEEMSKKRLERFEKAKETARTYHYAAIDFHDESDVMWMWWIWKVPVILFITPSTSPDRAYDIRTWKVSFLKGVNTLQFIQYIGYPLWSERLAVWTSSLSPGGSRDWIPKMLTQPSNYVYEKYSKIPIWLVGMLTTAFGTSLMKLLHRSSGTGLKEEGKGSKKKKETIEEKKQSVAAGKSSAIVAEGAKKRK